MKLTILDTGKYTYGSQQKCFPAPCKIQLTKRDPDITNSKLEYGHIHQPATTVSMMLCTSTD